MTTATVNDIRQKFLAYYAAKGHAVLPSAPLVPENDPTTLFTGSGMQPILPYLLGAKHAEGTRLADSQKSFRTGDIEDVGDNRHTTFFEMLGNWSLGDYFKAEQLPWIFHFLTDEIGLDPKRIFVTVFSGDEANKIPKDTESAELWKKLFEQKGIDASLVELVTEENGAAQGMQGGRIFSYREKNWWSRVGSAAKMPVGEPGGPDSEIFFEFSEVEHDTKYGAHCHPNCDCGRYLEIGNSVFMEYRKTADGFEKLPEQNVDFGGGLERMAAAANGSPDVFKIDAFAKLISLLEDSTGKRYADFTREFRIIADHIRAAVFLIADGVLPANSDQGYFVRRIIRRAVRYASDLGSGNLEQLVEPVISSYFEAYPALLQKRSEIESEIGKEELKFRETLGHGLHKLEQIIAKNGSITGKELFDLYQSYGFPRELSEELVEEIATQTGAQGSEQKTLAKQALIINPEEFDAEQKKHQELSRAGAEKKFKGGLADTGEMSVKYHTATHLLHQALREVLGSHVEQKGSNITAERLRFDFSHTAKMTDEEKSQVEKIVNEKIAAKLPVHRVELSKEEAEKTGALHFFSEKYGDTVSVYYVGDSLAGAFSKEYCGGPHVENTGTLGHFKIQKEEASSAGIRRIKAVLE